MAASYKAEGDSFVPDPPRVWTSVSLPTRPRQRYYDLHPDGNRIAMGAPLARPLTAPDKVVFVFNFFDELKRLAPAK